MGNQPGHQQDSTRVAQCIEPIQTPRKESDVAIATQRMRNAAALMRAQQKVARERRNPVRQSQVDMLL